MSLQERGVLNNGFDSQVVHQTDHSSSGWEDVQKAVDDYGKHVDEYCKEVDEHCEQLERATEVLETVLEIITNENSSSDESGPTSSKP